MRVLIVDDEQYIVEYLRHLFNWRDLGFCEVLTTTKSAEAKQLLLETKPELLITDIKMPGITGLDLAEMIMKEELPTKTIILSGFNDFSFAQKALRFGTVDYLLKPVGKSDLLPVVSRIVAGNQALSEFDIQDLGDSTTFFIESLSTISSERNYPMDLTVAWLDDPPSQALSLFIEEQYFSIFSNQEASRRKILTGKKVTKETLQQEFFHRFGESSARYVFPPRLQQAIKAQDFNLVRSLFCNLRFADVGEAFHYGFDVLKALSGVNAEIMKNIELSTFLENAKEPDFLLNFIGESMQEAKKSPAESNYSAEAMEKIKTYITTNYHEDITLDVLGEVVHMHPVTVSRLFKNTTGATISTFLMNIRMEAAKELLIHSNLLVSDVGNMVGYHKTQHFITVFKKTFGQTPQRYRRRIQVKGEEHEL